MSNTAVMILRAKRRLLEALEALVEAKAHVEEVIDEVATDDPGLTRAELWNWALEQADIGFAQHDEDPNEDTESEGHDEEAEEEAEESEGEESEDSDPEESEESEPEPEDDSIEQEEPVRSIGQRRVIIPTVHETHEKPAKIKLAKGINCNDPGCGGWVDLGEEVWSVKVQGGAILYGCTAECAESISTRQKMKA